MEFTLFSRATSPVQLPMTAFFYCVFKAKIYNEELNLSLLKHIMFGRVVLGSPKPLECTKSFPYQILTSLIFNGRSPMWYSIPYRSSQGLLEPLKLSVCSMLPKVSSALCFLLLASLSFLCSRSLCLHSLLYFFFVYPWVKANFSLTVYFLFRPFGSPAFVLLEFPASASFPSSIRKWPLLLSRTARALPWWFDIFCYVVQWLFRQLSGQIGPQTLCVVAQFPFQIWFLHRVQSLPSDLEPPDPMVFAHFGAVDLLDR